jgi:hypothetical protein
MPKPKTTRAKFAKADFWAKPSEPNKPMGLPIGVAGCATSESLITATVPKPWFQIKSKIKYHSNAAANKESQISMKMYG